MADAVKPGEVIAAVKADVKAVELSVEERIAALESRVEALEKRVESFFKRIEERIVGAFKHIGHDIRSIF